MTANFSVKDVAVSSVVTSRYDFAIFASGYESRCTHFAKKLERESVAETLVLGFPNPGDFVRRKASDDFFLEKWLVSPSLTGAQGKDLPTFLERQLNAGNRADEFRILVDYSSMSRMWYSAILNFARFTESPRAISIDFVYSHGVYSKNYAEELSDSVVEEIVSIPGMEGLSASREESVAVLGLGFTPLAGLGVIERLQPTSKISFYASPTGENNKYDSICIAKNQLILDQSDLILPLPIDSVESAFRRLCETITPFLDEQLVTLIPMGPKPHVLASLLVASKFRAASCLYAKMRRTRISDVPASGKISCCNVFFQS